MNRPEPYLKPNQTAAHPPTDWENELADVIEVAFAEGAWELDALVARLNASRVRPKDGSAWTAESYVSIMRTLGA